jgi:3-oxoadipate:acetyl-CoA acetyltransferase
VTPPPLLLNLAPTGMVPTRKMSPHVPLQPDEVVADVLRCAEQGITVAHLHARDQRDDPTHSKDVYARIISGIREQRPDLVLCVSTSGRVVPDFGPRAEVLELQGDLAPDMASLTLSSLNFPRQASVNAPDVVIALAERMKERGIRAEAEIFDLGMVAVLRKLRERGVLGAPAQVNLLFGNLATAQADLQDIGALVGRLPADTIWSLAGIGAAQLPVAAIAAAAAPGVRIGLEDNLWLDDERTLTATNAELVGRVHALAEIQGRAIMAPSELRALLGLPRR